MTRAFPASLLLALALPVGSAAAEEADAPSGGVAAADATALRHALPAPREAWRFEAPLLFEGFRVGHVRVVAEPASVQGRPAWRVLERTVREAGQARVLTELAYDLSPDLTLLRGESLYDGPTGRSITSFGRRDGAMECVREGGQVTHARHAPPPDASLGLFATVSLAATLPARAGVTCRLPVFDPRYAFGDDHGEPLPADVADQTLETLGAATLEGLGATLAVRVTTRYARDLTLHLDPASRALKAVDGLQPRYALRPGATAPPPPWFERVGRAPESALEAFVTFGRGYHLPRRELLESAFHWPSMRAHEIEAGTYPADVALERVRDDWIAEFVKMSKRRSLGDCDDLLLQLMAASTLVRADDGGVTLSSPLPFGGHAYTMRALDGRWWITRVD